MRRLISSIIIAAIVLGSFVGCADSNNNNREQETIGEEVVVEAPNEVVEGYIEQMTLEEKIGQMLMPDIRMWNGENTIAMNEGTAQMIRDHHLGGVILFEKNIVDQEQLIRFTDELQKEAGEIPLFIAIDQEGGRVKRIPEGTNMPGNMALGATASEELAYIAGKTMGTELKALGINLNFAPVLDININPDNPVIGVRSFGADPQLVSDFGIQYTQGLHEAGVAATIKHFPGHGDTDVDSHLGLPVLPHDLERLEEVELKPFREAIAEGVDMVMTAHVTFPAVDDTKVISQKYGNEISVPATLSHRVLTQLLREEMGFEGVIVTDAFNMKAIADHFGEEEAVIRAIEAGADIILMPKDLDVAYDAILKAVEDGVFTEERIDESLRRILTFKYEYGMLETQQEEIPVAEKIKGAEGVIGSRGHKAVEEKIAEEAVTLVKNEKNLLPLHVEDKERILLLAPQKNHLQWMRQTLDQITQEEAITVTIEEAIYENPQDIISVSQDDLSKFDYVILATQNLEEKIELPSSLYENLVIMAIENPYDLMYLPGAETYIAVYAGEEPNLTAGIKTIFGKVNPKGKLPVAIPNLNGKGNLVEIGHGENYK